MDSKEFDDVLSRQIQLVDSMLGSKAKEYADDVDRLHNFKIAAGINQGTPKQACWGFLTKHLTSLSDMVNSDQLYSSDMWDEKITDSINYLILLRALEFEADFERMPGLRPLLPDTKHN